MGTASLFCVSLIRKVPLPLFSGGGLWKTADTYADGIDVRGNKSAGQHQRGQIVTHSVVALATVYYEEIFQQQTHYSEATNLFEKKNVLQ